MNQSHRYIIHITNMHYLLCTNISKHLKDHFNLLYNLVFFKSSQMFMARHKFSLEDVVVLAAFVKIAIKLF